MDYNLYCVVYDNRLLCISSSMVDALRVCRKKGIPSNNIFIGFRNCGPDDIDQYQNSK